MNLIDLLIVAAAFAYGFGGYRNGAVIGVFSMLGFLLGATIGFQLAIPLSKALANGTAQVPVALAIVLTVAILFQAGGVWLGITLRRRLVPPRARYVDAGFGALFGVVSVLVVSWLIAVPLASSPYPKLASEASHSSIVRAVNGVMPNDARGLYASMRTFLDRSGFPPVFGDLPSLSIVNVAPPDTSLSPEVQGIVERAQQSVLKVYGDAAQCGRAIEGSGFVYAPQRVLTNAHVVAGTDKVSVQVNGQDVPARVVLYDSHRDVAVLAVPGLAAPVLPFAPSAASTGDPAVVLGYPEDGPFTANAARIRSKFEATGRDIYGSNVVTREVYAVRGTIRSGNSGGPLISENGTVWGVVFAAALDSPDTGYALSDDEIRGDANTGVHASAQVGTGGCTPG